jgi:phytoene dehydrogenase-like protein
LFTALIKVTSRSVMEKREFDAIVVGSGPNGLAAAITLQRKGLSVLVVESKASIGGGMRTEELTLPGFRHDVCSAIHPLAIGSPFFQTLPLEQHGLQYLQPHIPAAHPFDDGTAAALNNDLHDTARMLGADQQSYISLLKGNVEDWASIANDVLGPLHFPRDPFKMAGFGLNAITSAAFLSKRFTTREGKGLWAGMAAHSMQPLTNLTTSAIALVLMTAAHLKGWPIPRGGTSAIANALASYFTSLGGKIETNLHVTSLTQLPSAHAVLFDVTPRQLLQIAGDRFSDVYASQLRRFRYGAGVFKIDWALGEPIPFIAESARHAGTVHIGNTYEEISAYERDIWNGKTGPRPFVLLAQPSLFDQSRAPSGKHTGWAYCHVPNGSTVDMTDAIENQVERFAPGFRERILARHTFNAMQMESYNNNYVGGDINGGVLDITQLFTRPALRTSPYRTSSKGLYICSSSTPPGGGVHGMCGYHAASRVLKDIFKLQADKLYENGRPTNS